LPRQKTAAVPPSSWGEKIFSFKSIKVKF
jgi:hypothetical protein